MLPCQTSVPTLCDEKVIWLHKQSEVRDSIVHFFYVYIPKWGWHTGFLFSCQVSLSQWCLLFCFGSFCPDNVFTRESHGQVSSAVRSGVSPIYLSPCVGVTNSRWMLVNNMLSRVSLFSWRIPKRCKNVVNVWLKVSLAGLHISDSFVYQRNTITLKNEERFAVLYIRWCLFSILTLQVTSEGATSTGFCTYM